MIKAVVFDLDDTLISEREYIKSGYHCIASVLSAKLNVSEKELFSELFRLFSESPLNVFNRLLDKYDSTYSMEVIQELVFQYRNHFPQISFFSDVIPCIKSLQALGIMTGIITDGYLNAQKQKVLAVDAYSHFNEIIFTDELGREYWKPNSKPFQLMREKLNIQFDELIYVGDNPQKDFIISNNLPLKTVRIYRENGVYLNSEYLGGVKETYSVKTLLEISNLVSLSNTGE